ncbi:MAG: putative Ig domain-containing protein [Acidobacteriia bacterium]|nr:putative Ig domain-containing protein [Terriglobia bacterium]
MTLTGTGATAPYTWTATGMPAGFTITPGADTTTAVMAGTPTAVGPITIVVTVTDSTTPSHPFVSKSFTLTVASGVSITTTRLADGVATAIYPGDFLQATGGTPPYTWSATGLPAGLLINPNNGVVSGQPTTEGQYTVNVVATDSTTPAHLSAAKQIPITIGPKPSITTAALPNGITGAPYSFTMAATGGTAPLTWSATGMPAGITINTATGVISGTAGAAGSYPLSITASDSTLPVSLSVTAQLTLKIVSVLTVTTSALPVGFTDRAYSATVEAAGGVPPYSWTAPGLPAGFTITPGTDTTKAVIAGTAAATSSSTVNITVSDSATPTHQSTSKPLTLTIALGLSITTASLPNGFSGSPYAASMAATGGTTPYSWSATGLPDGVTINISTGAISGTPATAGPYTIAVTATDATSPTLTATRQYSITMAAGPQITTASLPARPATSPYSASLAASGGTPPYTWSQTGLPAGLSINTSTGEISGTPSADGSSNVTVSITDSTSPTHLTSSRQYTLTIGPKLSITTTGLPAHPANSAYSFTVLAAGGTMPYAFAATGLPATFAINSTTGAITGNPTVASSGTVTVTVTDATTPGGQTASAQFTLSIGQPLALVTASLPSRPAGSAYSAPAMTATGGTTPYIWSATGLPADGNFTIDPATGVITGTATTPGTSTVTVSVTDSTTPTPQVQSKPLALTITPGPSITTAALPQGQKGTHYSFTVQGTGGTTPYTWSMTGQPAGFAINASTGEISGDPTSESAGTVTVTVTDATSPTHLTVQKTFTLTVTATTYIKTATLPNGTTNSLYSATLEAAGGTPPYSWSAPDLPRNLTIGATNGVIGGTPVNQGTTIISFTVTDSSTPVQTFTRGISLTILNPPPVILTTSLPDGTVDVPYSATVEATSGLPPYNWTAVGIPVGLGLNNITGIISGIPTTPGIYTVTVTATDTIGQHMSKEFTVTVSNVLPGGWIVVSSANVGQNLQVPVTITLNPPPSAGVVLTLTSDNPAVVLGSSLVAGSTYTTANISAGTTMVSTYAKATDASGTAKITASILGYRDGTGTVTMSPASFMLSSKNGMGAAYDTYQSVTSPLTVYAARLDGSGVFAETQELRGGYTVSVPLSNTPTGPGAVSPASVSFSGGMKQTDASFVATTPGVSTITVVAPPPFATPSTGASVVVTVKAQGILPCDPNNPTVAIGKNLQARTCVQLTGGALNPVSLTVHSSDASKLKFSTTPNGVLSDTLTLTIPLHQKFSPDFYAHALGAEGPVTYTASADTYGSADLTATIAPSGFVIQTPFGMDADFNVSLGAGVPGLYVWTGRLNAAGAVAETQAVAGGLSVQVSVTSGTATVGTISASPITIAAGAVYGYTDFHPLAQGSTTITASSSGWADGSVLATVVPPTVVVSGDVTIGKFLQAEGTFILPVPAPAGGVRVTLKSNSPLLKISMDPLAAGSDTAYIDFTVGQYIASYYMQALGSTGTVTYTASAPGYNSKDGNVILAPSGIVILGPSIVSLTGGDQPLSVFAAQLDSSGTPLFTQALAGGSSVAVTLNSTNRAVGDIPGTVVIQPNTSGGTAVFHPLLAGYTSITVVQPSSDWFTPNMWTGLTISVQ